MAGLLGEIFSAGNVAKRKLTDLLGNPLLSAQQFMGNVNDRARNLNEMTSAAAREGMDYGPATQRLAGLMADAYNPVGMMSKIPSPKSLTMPDVPSVEQMQKYGRTESVPLSEVVSFQTARKWDKFNAGEHPGDLIQGYGDKPVALRLETGEYVIYDGNHRTDLALQKGKKELPMYVIDVKSYDPVHAGRKPVPPRMSDDELLRSLLD